MEQVSMRVVWRFAGMRPGALCVMDPGQNLVHKWPADSWDTQQSVMECTCNSGISKAGPSRAGALPNMSALVNYF